MTYAGKRIVLWTSLVGLCLWGVLIYSNVLKAPFVFDDEVFVLKNPVIRELGSPVLWQDLNYRKRIVAFFSFAANYRFSGNDTVGYHAVNLAVHLLAALSVFWLVRLLLRTPRMRGEKIAEKSHAVAFLTSALFLVHPIQTEAVTFITQRFESLAALFYLVSACCYISARIASNRRKEFAFFFLAAFSAVLGMLTKETVFTLPLALLLVEWLFMKDPAVQAPDTGKKSFRAAPWIAVGATLLLGILLFFLFRLDLRRIWSEHEEMGIPARQYFLTEWRVIPQYLGLLFSPLRQNFDHDIPFSSGLLDGSTFPGGMIVLTVLGLLFLWARRFPMIGFGMLWVFLTLSPSSSIIPLKDAMAEHRLYLPSAGFVVAVCAGLYTLTRNFRFFVLSLVSVILMFSFLTYQRNAVWTDEVRLWEDTVKKSPMKARPYANLARAYRQRGEPQKAVEYCLKAIDLCPIIHTVPLAQIHINLGAAYTDQKKYREAISAYRRAIDLDPGNPQAYSNAAFLYSLLDDPRNALAYGEKAVQVDPRFDEAWNNLGVVYARLGKYGKARECFEKVLKINPLYEDARSNLDLARRRQEQESHSFATFSGSLKDVPEMSPTRPAGRDPS